MKLKQMVSIGLVLLMVALSAGCETSTGETLKKYDEAQTLSYTENASSFSNDVSEYEIFIPKGYESGCIAGTKNDLYYTLVKNIPMGMGSECTDIFHLDTKTGNAERIFQIKTGEHWQNELVAADGALFWILQDASGMRLERYDLEHGTVSTVKEFSDTSPEIIISGGQDYLTWNEYNQEEISLYAYAIDEERIFCVSEKIAPQSSYTRAYVNDGITVFTESRKGVLYLCVYDIHEQMYLKQLRVTDSQSIINPQANSQYIVWIDEYEDPALYAYTLGSNELRCISKPGGSINLFSFHLLKDMVILNERRSGQIIGRLLDEGQEAVLSEQIPGEHLYILGTVFDARKFIAFDSARNSILFIR
ncbi:hypothetical protein [Candidatus Contubernalis alkaliaceticus]|uniref:hypothetical protein n=1 Tax=Candidatus Contubernalis alkaliaceticus TaxID=338645 RepID=UPI001F4C2255|nr:hypothetical protein [Candidatus Contubernalis alkalaceticus]UNC92803.1 hypothetical protein HUE98_12270 [Candidatus Contubernalis alkalaceticus]